MEYVKTGLIFDLDMTLVDSSIAENARKNRRWGDVYNLIPQFTLYEGMEEVFDYIRSHGYGVALVSSAPSTYIKRVVNHFRIPVKESNIIGYYESNRRVKPDPYPIRVSAYSLGEEDSLISFGDRAIDMQASRGAKIDCVACFWGTQEPELLAHSGYDYAAQKPTDIINLLEQINHGSKF